MTALSAKLGTGSKLIDKDGDVTTFSFGDDVSGHWGFRSNMSAGTSPLGPVGSYGVASIGDINGEADTFGDHDLIDDTKTDTDFETSPPNGAPFAILPNGVEFLDGLVNKSPFIQDSVVFRLPYTGTLTTDMITNVQPYFGTNSHTVSPEPSSLVLLGTGMVSLLGFGAR